jgi:hypothetical protein
MVVPTAGAKPWFYLQKSCFFALKPKPITSSMKSWFFVHPSKLKGRLLSRMNVMKLIGLIRGVVLHNLIAAKQLFSGIWSFKSLW